MANEKQFGIKEVMNIAITNYSTGAAIAYIPYATETSIMSEATRLDIEGGQGFYRLTSFDYGKKVTSKISIPLVDLNLLAHLTGTDLSTGATTAHQDEVLISSGATPTITLSSTPTSGTLKIYKINGDYDISTVQTEGTPATTENQYSISGTTVTLHVTSGVAGTKFLAMYDYTTGATATLITQLADRFNDFVRITGSGLWRNVYSTTDEVVSFDLKKCKFKPNYTLTQASSSATTLELEADLYFVTSGANKLYMNIVKI